MACAQNHDQVGNRAIGDRLPPAKRRVRRRLSCSSASTPRCSSRARSTARRAPFQYFTDHIDPFIAAATREGRRREFAHFDGFAAEVPGPAGRGDLRAVRLDARRAGGALRSPAPPAARAAARAGDRGGRSGSYARAPTRPRHAERRFRERDRGARGVRLWPGHPFPLGPWWNGEGTNFSLFSEHAEKVELCLFDERGPRDALRADRAHGVQLARLPRRSRPGPAVRLPRPRALGRRSKATASTRASS